MTLKVGRITGAADSGTRFQAGTLAATERKADWKCPECRRMQKGSWARCLIEGCNAKRPA